jgi:hypothetical protein
MTRQAEEYAAWVVFVIAAFVAVFLSPYIAMEVYTWM